MIHFSQNLIEFFKTQLQVEDIEKRIEDMSYGFDFIDISKTDTTRLSGMALNKKFTDWPSDQQRTDSGTFLKPGKFIKAVFPEWDKKKVDEYGHVFAQALIQYGTKEFDGLLVSDKPSEVYMIKHASGGSCGGSCMRNSPRSYFTLYDSVKNTKILYKLTTRGELDARALLHYNAEIVIDGKPTGKFANIMDRIYVTTDSLVPIFKKWADAHNFYTRLRQNNDVGMEYSLKGKDKDYHKFLIRLDGKPSYPHVPYLDSFPYVHRKGLNEFFLSNSDSITGLSYVDQLRGTGGSSSNGRFCVGIRYFTTCADCRTPIANLPDAVEVDRSAERFVCMSCFESGKYSSCSSCGTVQAGNSLRSVPVDGKVENLCNDCISSLSICGHCGGYTRKLSDVKYKKSAREDFDKICEVCHDVAVTECQTCHTFHPDFLSECPECKARAIEVESTLWVYRAIARMVKRYPAGIKNQPCTFINSDNKLVSLRLNDDLNGMIFRVEGAPAVKSIKSGIQFMRDFLKSQRTYVRDTDMNVKIDFSAFDYAKIDEFQNKRVAAAKQKIVKPPKTKGRLTKAEKEKKKAMEFLAKLSTQLEPVDANGVNFNNSSYPYGYTPLNYPAPSFQATI